jgi:spore maturation protein CgeB
MRVVLFYHSLVSDWNHGNAHFLRGIASELIERGHEVAIYEPEDGWSRRNLVAAYGEDAVRRFEAAFPRLRSTTYRPDTLDLDRALDGADLVIVHEWNDPDLAGRIGAHRAGSGRYRLLFHDTHHRAVSDRDALAACGLTHYDGVLAYGRVIRDLYLARGWASRAWTWHEAADTRVFRPRESAAEGDVVWIGNWGDGERSAEIREYFIEPVRALGLRACVYGVRYPEEARRALAEAGIEYRGWLPNYEAPAVFARFRVTLHIPRRPYVETLPGIPTIRVFEALACGIPLVCSPWDDAENLFEPGRDFLVARGGAAMKRELERLLGDGRAAREMAAHGRRAVLARHTCAHRVDELLAIANELASGASAEVVA